MSELGSAKKVTIEEFLELAKQAGIIWLTFYRDTGVYQMECATDDEGSSIDGYESPSLLAIERPDAFENKLKAICMDEKRTFSFRIK